MKLRAHYKERTFSIEEILFNSEGKGCKHSRFQVRRVSSDDTERWIMRADSLQEAINEIIRYGTDEVTLEIMP